jgi:hypothetical protein
MKTNYSSGQVSRLLLVLAIIILVAVVITFLVMRMAAKPARPIAPITTEVPLPVYEKQLGDIRFVFESSIDKGGILRASEILNTQYNPSYQKDLQVSNPGARFIKVTIGAQNKGMIHTDANAWTIENIVDSENREFGPLHGYTVSPWLDAKDLCGSILQPAFDPTPCTKIYEVSKESTGMRIRIETGKDNIPNNLSSGKIDSFLLDLIVK